MCNLLDGAGIFDSHCHIDLEQFAPDRAAVVARARAAGVQQIVSPGIDLAQCRAALAMTETYPELWVAVGIHPNSASSFDDDSSGQLCSLAAHPRVVAIGEIGLDYYWDTVERQRQWVAFETQLDLAAELGLPVIIHSRDANADVAAVLRTWVSGDVFRTSSLAQRRYVGVLHAFSGDQQLAEEAYAWNFVLGLGGPVTFKNARALHALVPQLRLDRLMLETDAPYLAPHPYRGQRNEPAYLALVCRAIADLRAMTPADVAASTTAVAQQFFFGEDPGVVDHQRGRQAAHA